VPSYFSVDLENSYKKNWKRSSWRKGEYKSNIKMQKFFLFCCIASQIICGLTISPPKELAHSPGRVYYLCLKYLYSIRNCGFRLSGNCRYGNEGCTASFSD
jgi:hypothetical protein